MTSQCISQITVPCLGGPTAQLHAGMTPFEIGAVAGLMMLKERKVVVNGCEALLPSGQKLEGSKEGC